MTTWNEDKAAADERYPSPWTSHGFRIAGVPDYGNHLRPPVHRCGGPRMCTKCRTEADERLAHYLRHNPPTTEETTMATTKPAHEGRDMTERVAAYLYALDAQRLGYRRSWREVHADTRETYMTRSTDARAAIVDVIFHGLDHPNL